jgi:fatty-acyl-CoA synthase
VIAETSPEFLRFFFACQYAGLVPVALPASANLGGHAAYVARLHGLLVGCGASVATASPQFLRFLREAAEGMDLAFVGAPEDFDALAERDVALEPSGPTETGLPAIHVGQHELSARCRDHAARGALQSGGRGQSRTRHQAGRPLRVVAAVLSRHGSRRLHAGADGHAALDRLSRHARLRDAPAPLARAHDEHESDDLVQPAVRLRALCAPYPSGRRRSLRPQGLARRRHRRRADPRRVAGPLRQAPGARRFRSARLRAVLRMAESSLAISFAPLKSGVVVDWIDAAHLGRASARRPRRSDTGRVNGFVRCGGPLPATKSRSATTRDTGFPISMSGA